MANSGGSVCAPGAARRTGPGAVPVSVYPAGNHYAELKRLIQQCGLLDKQPAYYVVTTCLLAAMLSVGMSVIAFVDRADVQMLNAVFVGVVLVQISFLMHDAGHRQIYRSAFKNDALGLICGNLLLGISYSWWTFEHNRHHVNPNHIGRDPDIEQPVFALSREQALRARWPWSVLVKYQAFFFFPALLFEALNLRVKAIEHLLRGRAERPVIEWTLLACHYFLFFGLIFNSLETINAIGFVVINHAIIGLYVGMVFAPNHKGMPMIENEKRIGFFSRQILTARNVRASRGNSFFYGGLNCQIEHHLFPTISRNKIREVRNIVKPYCEHHGIPYHEVGMIQSFREILVYLHRMSAVLRAEGASRIASE